MITCSGVGGYDRMLQHVEVPMARMTVETPTLILVVHGTMLLRWAGNECSCAAGQAFALAEGQTFDMINRLADGGAPFEAHWLRFDPALTIAFAESKPAGRSIRDVFLVDTNTHEWTKAFGRAAAAVADPARLPAEVPELRMRELLAWLAHAGAVFGGIERPLLTRRIRRVIAKDIGMAWTIGRLAEVVALSPSTLRRRLTEEGTSFNRLLIDVRMSRALTLLQVTDLPVLQIAYQTGYDSPSRFTARFRQRFGLSPTEVRSGDAGLWPGAVPGQGRLS